MALSFKVDVDGVKIASVLNIRDVLPAQQLIENKGNFIQKIFFRHTYTFEQMLYLDNFSGW